MTARDTGTAGDADTAAGRDGAGGPGVPEVPALLLMRLEKLARQHSVYYGDDRLRTLAALEPAALAALPPAVVAFLRRTAADRYAGHSPLAGVAARLTEPVLDVGEAWAERALEQVGPGPDDPWRLLLAHALTATTARPSAEWDERALALVGPLGADAVHESLLAWLDLVGAARTLPLERWPNRADVNQLYDPFNATALRGLAWLLSLLPARPGTARALGALVETSLRKVAGIGPRSPKVANAGVLALARTDGEESLAELARLATRVTYRKTAQLIDGALNTRAEAMGLGRDEIEELAVPSYGLTEVGAACHSFGEAMAVLRIEGTRARLTWKNATGNTVKSVPAAVRREHAEELKELKAAVKDIDRTLTAQRERLDRHFLARRTWDYDTWRARLLDHPLVGTLARRLLWTVDGTAVGFADGALRTLADAPVTGGRQVELWHPIGCEPAEIMAWRDWLERHAITQPFKQAHREVYLLTDAERTTGVYSNRFAGHILRQHQFHSLTAVRGWRNKLRLCVDDHCPPATRELPAWGLRAEYWVHGDGDDYGADLADSGSYLRISTDQVRFYPLDAPENFAHCSFQETYRMSQWGGAEPVEPLPLTGIPPLVLSEVLRDVDLFVGVASVGNDPLWQDGGPGGRHRDYWTSYGFGELNQSAETRRALLERLVPRLAIAGRCTIEGRFLLVRGERHAYRIHLGSGNVLISPDDRYLCIIPKRTAAGATGTGYLPYEGDTTLAVILSKAMLLAEDTKITDPTILGQL